MTRTLYLCYFGLREPLVQTQVLPYLRQLRDGGVGVSLLTFEPDLARAWEAREIQFWSDRLAAEGIRWCYLPYHKRPSLPATVFDILVGARFAARLARREGIGIYHARGHMAAAMGALAKRLAGGKLIFDIRGFMPEEYVDAGIWKQGGVHYRLTKTAEGKLLQAADAMVVLTERAREILFPGCTDTDDQGRPLAVIPCCVDLQRFAEMETASRAEVRREFHWEGRRVIAYVGALGGWYLTAEMADFLGEAHRQDPTTFSLILTQSSPELIREPLRAAGVPETDCLIRRVAPGEIPRYLRGADLALSFIKPCYSKLASSPTKLAEYLASGLPVVCNGGIGDVDALVTGERVGVIVDPLGPEGYARALETADRLRSEPDSANRCREAAVRHFDLAQVGGRRYRRLYERLVGLS